MPRFKKERTFAKRLKQWIDDYDGNYCGADRSNGRRGKSVAAGTAIPITPLDSVCKTHDEDLGQQMDPLGADIRFVGGALGAAMTPHSLSNTGKSVLAAAAVGLQGVARRLNFIEDTRVARIDAPPEVMLLDAPQHEPESFLFPVLTTMPKYARRRSRRRVRKYPKKNRKTFKSKRKSNKRVAKYRRRSTRRNRSVGYSKVNNSILKYEGGGSLEDANAVYLGHGTPTRQLARVFFMAMVRQLLAKYGITFTDWNETVFKLNNTGPDFDLTLFWNYGEQELIAWKESAILVLPTATYYTLADDLLSKFCADYRAAMDAVDRQYEPVFQKMVLYKGTSEVTENYELASIELKNMKVNFFYASSLRLQNQTANGSNTGVTDVNNVNPLEGKVYFGPKNKNFFPLKYKVAAANDASYRGWTSHTTHGWIRDIAAYHPESVFQDLPSARDVNAVSTKKFALHPGQIVVDKISHRHTYRINNFLKIMQNEWTSSSYHGMNLGTCRVMGFEKLLADRPVSPAVPGPVKVAWEINYLISCSISHYNVAANPRVTVVSAPIT